MSTGISAGHAGPRSIMIAELERIAADGWPGLKQLRLGGWLLRAGGGFTSRANSVLPLGPPGGDLPRAIGSVTEFYAARGLPARFQIPCDTASPDWHELDDQLAGMGWHSADPAVVLVADLAEMLLACDRDSARPGTASATPPASRSPRACELLPAPSPEWLDGYRYQGRKLPPSARGVLSAGGSPVFAVLREGSRRLGVARGIVTDGWLGVTALTVDPAARRRGCATALMADLGRWAARRDARSVYLQVAEGNDPAFALYDRLGFATHHRYHYREEPAHKPTRSSCR